ncbi:MAG: hypothetical protein ACM34O_15760 [Ignavibacteria bacterium]
MEIFDLGLAVVWEYDDDLARLVHETLSQFGISTYVIRYENIKETKEKVVNRKLGFYFYLDRAWDVEEEFEELGKILNRRKTLIFNPYKNVLHAIDKASMHLEFITAGLNVPYSIIIPPHKEKEEIFISVDDLARLGRPFIIKPCNNTGGGSGVVTGAETLKEIFDERIMNSNDKYLLQEKIFPTMLDQRRAWFRCFWAFGKVIPVWWDDQTHLYDTMTQEDIIRYNLFKISRITKKIANIIHLDFFSTEIVLTNENKFFVIDYVNDQCDMRIKSKHTDGVPDEIVNQIIYYMLRNILRIKKAGISRQAAASY